MNNPEILEQLKQLNSFISKALEEAIKGKNISFYKTLIQQNSIDMYQKASILEEIIHVKPAEIKIIRQEEVLISESIQPLVETETVKISEKKPVETVTTRSSPPIVKINKGPESDDKELSLNEKLSKNKQPIMNVTDKSLGMPIADLVKFIPIVKKFEFINGLFDGNAEVYKTSLHNVQNASSYEDAALFLESNIIGQYEWDTNEKLAAEFIGLIKRRFIQ